MHKNTIRNHFRKLALAIAFLTLAGAGQAAAQSTIFSTPSTDVLAKGKVGLRLIGRFKPVDQEAKHKFTGLTPRAYVGVGKNVEVGVNVLGNTQPGADSTVLVPVVKWRFYNNEKYGVAMAAGNHFYLPLRNKKYDAGSYSYVTMSKSFESGTRLTAGSYYFTNNVVAKNASRAGGQFGIEQRLDKTFAVAAEWMTGRHSNGLLTAGLKIKFNKKFSGNVGYTVANDRAAAGNHYFYTSLGYNF